MGNPSLVITENRFAPSMTLIRSTAAARLRDVLPREIGDIIAKNFVIEDDEFGFYND